MGQTLRYATGKRSGSFNIGAIGIADFTKIFLDWHYFFSRDHGANIFPSLPRRGWGGCDSKFFRELFGLIPPFGKGGRGGI
jgi:hypothetical protein